MILQRFSHNRMTPEIAVRMVADALMVNAALIGALMLHYLWRMGIAGNAGSSQAVFNNMVWDYVNSFWLITAISLIVFYISGFYTRSRAYANNYKALVVVQAVGLSYLIFGFVILLMWDVMSFPRSVLFPAWILTTVFLVAARLWLQFWQLASQVEQQIMPATKEDKIKNVLLIGGAGYVGSALLTKLLARGYNVRLLDILLYGTEPIDDLMNDPKLEIVNADFRNPDDVANAMKGMDAVIHLGALVGDPACALDGELTIEVNLKATRMIAEIAKCLGIQRMVFASTCSVYGASDETLDEYSMLNPVSLYAGSKIAAEHVLQHTASESFSPVILRFGTIYGLSGRTRFDLVINLLTAKALVEDQITVFGGDQWRPFVHVDDAALAVFKALEAPRDVVHNEVFNVGSDEQNYTIQQVAEVIHSLVPNAEMLNMGDDTDVRNYRVSFDKIRRTLGFTPQWTVEQGVKQVMEAINHGQVSDYRDSKYSNVKFLQTEGLNRFFANRTEWTYDLLNETIERLSNERKLQTGENAWANDLITVSDNVAPSKSHMAGAIGG